MLLKQEKSSGLMSHVALPTYLPTYLPNLIVEKEL